VGVAMLKMEDLALQREQRREKQRKTGFLPEGRGRGVDFVALPQDFKMKMLFSCG